MVCALVRARLVAAQTSDKRSMGNNGQSDERCEPSDDEDERAEDGRRWTSSQLGTYLLSAKGREGKGGWRASCKCKDNAAGRLG